MAVGVNPVSDAIMAGLTAYPAPNPVLAAAMPKPVAAPVADNDNPDKPTSRTSFNRSANQPASDNKIDSKESSELDRMAWVWMMQGMNRELGTRDASSLNDFDFSKIIEAGYKFLEEMGISPEQINQIRDTITQNSTAFRSAYNIGGIFSPPTSSGGSTGGSVAVTTSRSSFNPQSSITLSSPTHVGVSDTYHFRHRHPVTGRGSMHHGTDFAAPMNTSLEAAEDGRLVFYGSVNGYGNVAVIDHGNGIYTQYAHLSRLENGIRVGQTLSEGQDFARSGNTGRGTGAHLHFEVWVKQGNDIHTVNAQRAFGVDLSNPASAERINLFRSGRDSAFTSRAETSFAGAHGPAMA